MTSRYSAARPKRASEAFARAHHGEDGEGSSANKKVKFDVRNPSALAPVGDDDVDEADEQILAADVIGGNTGATKRGAVNVDGYDSDSDQDNFEERAEARGKKKKGRGRAGQDVDLAAALDNYNAHDDATGGAAHNDAEDDDDEEVDMFGAAEDDGEDGLGDADEEAAGRGKAGKKGKEVRFLKEDEIEGQEQNSKSGGIVRINDEESSDDDEEAVELAIQEEGVDEEVGAGGLKKHAPKIDAFNMKAEQEEGRFDEAGNFIRNAADPNAVHDKWLEGVSKKEMKKAAAAHEKRQEELRQQRKQDESVLTADLFKALILRLERGETALEALARLAKNQTKPKKVPKWKQKKQKNGADAMDVDADKESQDPKQIKIREDITTITEAADRLLGRDNPDIYDTEREMLIREWQNETGERWVEPPKEDVEEQTSTAPKMWEYRWIDGRDGAAKQGPFDGPTMQAWQDAGYFGEGVEFRQEGQEGWARVANFV
ncbi:LIN1-like protein [Coniochaeta hoffmannii]|uniref:LIN1-like protein n=1 Tax=Coniochaeta hoffmannii TaxID=91930 RepID=A0AA38S8H7_9PEZI|nr:LIN1-like protein [Coniochaeta hoffmannii]